MFDTLKRAWKMPDLRSRLLFTLMILVVFRIGAALPVPFLDASAMAGFGDGNLFGYLNLMTGGAFQNGTLFALSITPYISASIIIQLLTVAIPALEKLSKEGESGRKKLKKIERGTTVALALIESFGYYNILRGNGAVISGENAFASFLIPLTIVLTFTAGSMICVWLGEKIDEKGIGNGISMLLFTGIVSGGLTMAITVVQYFVNGIDLLRTGFIGEGLRYVIGIPVIVVLFVLMIAFIILMTKAERRIPVQYAKRVVGRKMYGGQSSHLPISVNLSGVLPVIFASTILAIPTTIGAFVTPAEGGFMEKVLAALNYDSPFYAIIYFVLIVAFAYFYVAIQYNPIEMANNLRKQNGAIPGIRPGKPTSDFIARIISKVTMVGALFLAVVAILPIFVAAITGINISFGGTTIIIVVGVALDTARQLESEMMMRHYKGFLE